MTELKDIQKELNKVFKDLIEIDKSFTERKKNNMVKRAAKGMQEDMIRRAPKKTGDLKLTIGFKKFRNNAAVFLGVIRNKVIDIGGSVGRIKIDKAFIARFIEFGFTHIAWPRKGKRVGNPIYSANQYKWIEGKPFIRPAFDDSGNRNQFFEEMRKEVYKAIEKANKAKLKLTR